MKHLAAVLLAVIAAAPALGGVIFEDHFDADSLNDYTQTCYADSRWPGSATWQVSNGILRGQSLGGTVCYAGVGDPTWEISSVHVRMRTIVGFDKGVNVVNTAANIGVSVNLRPAPYNDVMLGYNQQYCCDTVSLPHVTGQWMDVEIRIVGTDMQVYVNGAHLATRAIQNPAGMLPLNAVRPWTYTCECSPYPVSALNEYDDLVVVGNGVVAVDGTTWGALKATYR